MTEDSSIPTYPLSEVGRNLVAQFNANGLDECSFIVRAPGRVNLIGEHIDYNGYPVLPMALEQAVHIAVSPCSASDDAEIILLSTDPKNAPMKLSIEEAMKFGSGDPPNPPYWYHYFLCAYRGIVDYVHTHSLIWTPPSMKVLVGNVDYGGLWPEAGISSSSAFVVASVIAVMHISGLRIERRELAGLCADCERYVGMQGGGMDQTASIMAHEHNALLIEFTKPLVTVRPVPLPSDLVFVIAHTGVQARKVATSRYNERVSECRLAAKILCMNSPNAEKFENLVKPLCLADAQRAWNVSKPKEMIKIVAKLLNPGITRRKDLYELGLTDSDIESCLTSNTKEMQEFHLRDRAEHVFSEADRVYEFHDVCQTISNVKMETGDDSSKADLDYYIKLGSLMNQSQESCAKLYQCSCPELDRLVSICLSAGASGSRLTGAGWGGCTVSLVRKTQVDKFIQDVRKQFYNSVDPNQFLTGNLIFISQPGPPAGVMNVKFDRITAAQFFSH